ncbi:hypothetical protein [Luteibacter sp. ME-Dv--P-043b]|uniref:hypothetical protein n=1 Tax=Luteibacter sp. ME-Dv--P-043b TaxID=3040291 RepID=UPI002555364F|nr:hypothetical protein [Luteibacter sp. ME-Dv--P-043b]
MSTKITKAVLLSQVEELKRTINMLQCVPAPAPRTLKSAAECPVQSGYRGEVHLTEVDRMREAMRRRVANELAEELIRSGSVKFTERLIRDSSRYTDVVRIEAVLAVAA